MFSWMGGLGRQSLGGQYAAGGPQTYGAAWRRPIGQRPGLPPNAFSKPFMGQPPMTRPGGTAPSPSPIGQPPMQQSGGSPRVQMVNGRPQMMDGRGQQLAAMGGGIATASDYFERQAAAGGNPQPLVSANAFLGGQQYTPQQTPNNFLPSGFSAGPQNLSGTVNPGAIGPQAPAEQRWQDRSQPAWAQPAPYTPIQFNSRALTPEQRAAIAYAPVNMGGGMTNMGGIGSNFSPQPGIAYNGRGF